MHYYYILVVTFLMPFLKNIRIRIPSLSVLQSKQMTYSHHYCPLGIYVIQGEQLNSVKVVETPWSTHPKLQPRHPSVTWIYCSSKTVP
jgi:hypothetical protein